MKTMPEVLAIATMTGVVGLFFGIVGKALWEFFRKDKELNKIAALTDQITALVISNSEIKSISKDNKEKINEMHPIIMRLQIKYEVLEEKVASNKVVDMLGAKPL